MLDQAEARDVGARFGVADDQVRRDHLISHLLAALGRELADEVVFFGGTALARTHLPAGRLSEDIDLIATGNRRETARRVDDLLVGAVRREYGRLAWVPSLSSLPRATGAAVLRTDDGLTVRVQLLTGADRPRWPTEERDLVQRYSDAARWHNELAGQTRVAVDPAAALAAVRAAWVRSLRSG